MNVLRWLRRPGPAFCLLLVAMLALAFVLGVHTRQGLALALAAAVIVESVLVLGVHEAGHIVGGLSAGFRFEFLVVGPLSIYTQQGRVRCAWNDSWLFFGGIALAVPTSTAPLDTAKMARYAAGGPLASLALGLVGVGALYAFDLEGIRGSSVRSGQHTLLELFASLSCATSGFLSLAIFCVTSFAPSAGGGMQSDGARVLMLVRGGPRAERWSALSVLVGASLRGDRPRDLPAAALAAATRCPDGSFDHLGAALIAYSAAVDRANLDEARRYLDEALAIADAKRSAQSTGAFVEKVWFEARHGTLAEAERWMATAEEELARRGSFVARDVELRARAALALARGDRDGARQYVAQGLQALESDALSRFGNLPFKRELLEDLASRLAA